MNFACDIQNQLVGSDDRNNWNELQSNCCNVIQVSLRQSLACYVLLTRFCDATGHHPKGWTPDRAPGRPNHERPASIAADFCKGRCCRRGRVHDDLELGSW
jgi:hypothetical protein